MADRLSGEGIEVAFVDIAEIEKRQPKKDRKWLATLAGIALVTVLVAATSSSKSGFKLFTVKKSSN